VSTVSGVELSVVLVNYNGADCLPATLSALARNTSPDQVEGIVVDSGSTDGSWREVERHWPNARALRFEDNIGFTGGCNRGAEAARGRLLAFVNFDGEVEPSWDAPLRALLDDASVSAATGLLLSADGSTIEAAGLEIAPNGATFGRCEGQPRTNAPRGPVDVVAASGALMMVRRDDFLALGGFYEPIFMYGEEADYFLRSPARVVLDPRSAIRHSHGAAAGPPRSEIRLYWGSRNRLVNAARHLPARPLVAALAASAGFDALTLLQLRDPRAARAIARGWRDGLVAFRRERSARTPAQRREAASRLVSFSVAITQQHRLGRL
jgi:GT2 family glycosyltransferase